MTHRARALLSLAAVAVATPAFACPGMYSCVPIECLVPTPTVVPDRNPTRPQSGGGAGLQAFNSRNVTLQSQVTLAQMGGGSGSSLHGWVDPLTRREYAIMGRSSGTSFIDITNPTSPIVVGNLPRVTGSSATQWREPKVYQNTVYVGVDGTSVGMQVMDLTKLRAYAGASLTLAADSVYRPSNGVSTLNRIHTLGINPETGYLYAAGTNFNSGGLHVIDVRNPLAPVPAGNTNLDGYTHETQVVTYRGPDLAHHGKEIAFNSNGNSNLLSILDVTNKSAITRISARTYAGERYIHQGWLTENQRYFFQNDELDEPNVAPRTRTHLWDLVDLDNPVYRGFFEHQTISIDHNLYVKGDYVYQTNYTTGLRILKIGDLTSSDSSQWLTEVAYFDTYMLNDGATFNGAWNNYPYFPSGNIAVSDINGGLFVLRANLPDVPIDLINNPIPKFGPGGFLFNSVPEPGSLGVLAGAALVLALRRRGAGR